MGGHGGRRKGAGRKPKHKSAPAEPKKPSRPTLSAIEGGAEIITLPVPGGVVEPEWSTIYSDELDIALARTQWRKMISELRQTEKLAEINDFAVEVYVYWCVTFKVAVRHVAEEGAVFPRKGKKQPAYNPWFTVMKNASDQISVKEAELTVSPRRRNNGGKVKAKAKRTFASDEFLGSSA